MKKYASQSQNLHPDLHLQKSTNWQPNVDFDVVRVAEVTSWFIVLNQKLIKTNSSNKCSVIWKEQTTKLNKFVGFALKRMETHQWSLSHCHNEKDTFSDQRAGVIVTLWKQFQTFMPTRLGNWTINFISPFITSSKVSSLLIQVMINTLLQNWFPCFVLCEDNREDTPFTKEMVCLSFNQFSFGWVHSCPYC